MKKISVNIIFPYDPLGNKIGGAENFIKGFIKYAPSDFDIEFVGVTSSPKERPPRKWSKLYSGNKDFSFYPLFYEKDINRKKIIPLSLKFAAALKSSRLNFDRKLLFLNRMEPAISLTNVKSPKLAVVHNDIQKQVLQKGGEVFWSRVPWLYRAFENYIFKNLDCIYTVSKETFEYYRSQYAHKKGKFFFLPTWRDPDIFHPSDDSKMLIREKIIKEYPLLPLKDAWIIFVGRLQRQKAPMRLIETFENYRENNRNSSLIIIGDGNLRSDTETYAKHLAVADKVFFLGQLDQIKIADFYRASDVLLLTSDFEGMPMCVLEALGTGTPVVTTDVGEVSSTVINGFSGEVVEDFSPVNISRAIEKVVDNLDTYSSSNCVNTVSKFTPQIALKPVFENIRKVFERQFTN